MCTYLLHILISFILIIAKCLLNSIRKQSSCYFIISVDDYCDSLLAIINTTITIINLLYCNLINFVDFKNDQKYKIQNIRTHNLDVNVILLAASDSQALRSHF